MSTDQRPSLDAAMEAANRYIANVETVIKGKTDQVKLVLATLLCGGHVLLEDVPGTAKTVLARAIAGSIESATNQRVQCTPDLQPTDVTGLSVFNQRERDFEFRPGPVFANVLLVDEINRAMPKTQSALLEAMAERQVTTDGVTRPLPEAQLDRFFRRTALGYPGEDDELAIVEEQLREHPLDRLRPVVSLEDIGRMRTAVQDVYIDPAVRRWVIRFVRATREADGIAIGASVRGSLALERAARAWALLDGRDYVTPVDVEQLFLPVVMHRIVFTPSFVATAREIGWTAAADRFREDCLATAPRPGSELEVAEDENELAAAPAA
jgi:MoxR-like ATPase